MQSHDSLRRYLSCGKTKIIKEIQEVVDNLSTKCKIYLNITYSLFLKVSFIFQRVR